MAVKYKDYKMQRHGQLWITTPEPLRELYSKGVEVFQTEDNQLIIRPKGYRPRTEGTQVQMGGAV